MRVLLAWAAWTGAAWNGTGGHYPPRFACYPYCGRMDTLVRFANIPSHRHSVSPALSFQEDGIDMKTWRRTVRRVGVLCCRTFAVRYLVVVARLSLFARLPSGVHFPTGIAGGILRWRTTPVPFILRRRTTGALRLPTSLTVYGTGSQSVPMDHDASLPTSPPGTCTRKALTLLSARLAGAAQRTRACLSLRRQTCPMLPRLTLGR